MTLPACYMAEFSEPRRYLDFAGTGPPGRSVVAAVEEALQRVERAEEPVWEVMLGAADQARGRLAGLVGAAVDRVALTPSTSFGLFAVALGLARGNVVVPAHEFPANLYPWLRAAERGGPELRLLQAADGRVTPELVAELVDGDTAAVSVSLVDFRTGFRVDLDGLREAAGDALLVLDAMQGLGAVEVSFGQADVMVAAGHKWLRAGWGTGLMVLSERALERIGPALSGWYGADDHLDFSVPPPHPLRPGADRFQMGTPPALGGSALAAALGVLELAGVRAVEKAVAERVLELEEAMVRSGGEVLAPWRSWEERAGILCARLPREASEETAGRLRRQGFVLTERGGWMRFAPHATTPAGIGDELAAALTG